MCTSVLSATEARLVNTLTSRSSVIYTLGRYNRKCSVVENRCVRLRNVQISALLLKHESLVIGVEVNKVGGS
jgi:hypothetical protein